MFDKTKPARKFRQKLLMYSLLFFLPNILVKGLQRWKLSQMLHALHDFIFFLCGSRFHIIKSHRKFCYVKNI
jgi:hypothetical protein